MSEQLRFPLAGATDPPTSQKAALTPFKRDSQSHRLLQVYSGSKGGLTDEEASSYAGLLRGGWKLCSDLRNEGLITPTGETRTSSMGAEQRVCSITFHGRRALGLLS